MEAPSVALVTACLGDDECNRDGAEVLFTLLARANDPKTVCRMLCESSILLFLAPSAWAHALDDLDVATTSYEPSIALFFRYVSAVRALRDLQSGLAKGIRQGQQGRGEREKALGRFV